MLVKQAEKMLKITFLEAKLFKANQIDTEHVLLSMLKDHDNLATRALNKFKVDYEQVKQAQARSMPAIRSMARIQWGNPAELAGASGGGAFAELTGSASSPARLVAGPVSTTMAF